MGDLHFMMPLASSGAFFGLDGLIVLIIGLLLFGRGLPEVARNIYRSINDFNEGRNEDQLAILALAGAAFILFLLLLCAKSAS